MAEKEQISYTMEDPLTHEKPFFASNIELVMKLDISKKRFPYIALIGYGIVITFFVFIMGIFYIGGIWNPIGKIRNVDILIVDDDKGTPFSPTTNAMFSTTPIYMGENFNTDTFKKIVKDNQLNIDYVKDKSFDEAKELINDYEYWAVFYIPNNFTFNYFTNLGLAQPLSSNLSINLIYDEARSYTTVTYMKKLVAILEEQIFAIFVDDIPKVLNQTLSPLGVNVESTPLFNINGIDFVENNIHKVNGFGQNFSTFISLIIIWIGTIATSIITHFFYPFEKHWLEKKDANHAIAKTMILKGCISAALMFVITLITVIILYCCGEIQNEKNFGALLFFIYYFSFTGLGINNLFIHVLPFIIYYLLVVCIMFFQLISCGGLVDHIIQPGFWKIGKILPMYFGVREMKTIYWGTGSKYEVANVFIILAWAIVSLATAYTLYYFELKAHRKRWLEKNQEKPAESS